MIHISWGITRLYCLYSLALFCIKTLKVPNKILVIIQRSNGDVLLSVPLINSLQRKYKPDSIDLLVNEDTFSTAKLLPHISLIHTFSYKKKKANPWKQELSIIKNILL